LGSPQQGVLQKGSDSSQSWAYIAKAIPICFALDRHTAFLACSLALENTGNRIAAKMAIIAITTSSSINVKPRFSLFTNTFLTPPFVLVFLPISLSGLSGEEGAGGKLPPPLINPQIISPPF
jgi:hypothetical protein